MVSNRKSRPDKYIAINQRERLVLTKIFHLILSANMLAAAACSMPAENGTIGIQLTDAPFRGDLVEEANVTISRLEMREAAP